MHKVLGLVLSGCFHKTGEAVTGEDRDLLNGAQVLCFQFHVLCVIITASQSPAFQTGSLASVKKTVLEGLRKELLEKERGEKNMKGHRKRKRR